MSKLLTPHEVLQAIIDGKTVEVKFGDEWEWEYVLPDQMIIEELLDPEHQFRLPQETITIGDVSFPKPESEPLTECQDHFIPNPTFTKLYYSSQWFDTELDKLRLKRGLVHLTEENAIAHAKALIELSGGKL